MATSFKTAATNYLCALSPAQRTRSEYRTTLKKWKEWGGGTGEEVPWALKDLRKTCATYYDEHLPESSIEILGHAVGGITDRHCAHRSPLAFKAIMTLPQPSAFAAMVRGFDGECPCCRRPFADSSSRSM
ncbi:MAG TPA: hypothetical protein VM165_11510 [Planctomycetaceae bacterium]|nr:hypothetical protein [Planctomycetaceae bacterium]